MKSVLAFRAVSADESGAGSSGSSPKASGAFFRSVSAVTPACGDWQQLNAAIDVVASLAEQTSRIADRGASESMSKALEATFAYMVTYLHHLTIEQDNPRDALAKAATLSMELTPRDMDFLRAVARLER